MYKLLIFSQWIPIQLLPPSTFTINPIYLHPIYLNQGCTCSAEMLVGGGGKIEKHPLPWPMASSLGYGANGKACSDSCLFQSLQLYLRCCCKNWHLSNNKSLQFSLWDWGFMNYAYLCRFFTCDRCSMGNFPNILRKPAIIPVMDINEMFSSVYLTISHHHVAGERMARSSVIGGTPVGSSPSCWLLGGKMDRLCLVYCFIHLFIFLLNCTTWVVAHPIWKTSWRALRSISLRDETDVKKGRKNYVQLLPPLDTAARCYSLKCFGFRASGSHNSPFRGPSFSVITLTWQSPEYIITKEITYCFWYLRWTMHAKE